MREHVTSKVTLGGTNAHMACQPTMAMNHEPDNHADRS